MLFRTAVLGLDDIGLEASGSVMKGIVILFKQLSGFLVV